MNYVFTINDKNLSKLVDYYQKIEVESENPNHKHLFKTDDLTITVYKSNKVMFQGQTALEEYNSWAKLLGFNLIKPNEVYTDYQNQYFSLKVIGSDEVGTGDFFGPVVVCAAYVKPTDYPFLDELNIRDSKKISDPEIRKIGKLLVDKIAHHVLVTNNLKYNQLIKDGFNLNKIKAYLHNHAIKKMIDKHKDYKKIIVDEFCSEKNYYNYLINEDSVKNIDFLTQAESVHQSVAVAAIIARYKFLLEFDSLSKEIGITLPKGASAGVDAIAQVILLKHGIDVFKKIAKTNFKNYQKLLS
jgi:ribonuclease HIII